MLTKQLKNATDLSIDFSKYYRENRHETKIIKVVILADIDKNTEKHQEKVWEAKVKIPKEEGKIVWEFPDDCPEWIREEVTGIYDYIHFKQLLTQMKKRRVCM